jgi:hypothetical protein
VLLPFSLTREHLIGRFLQRIETTFAEVETANRYHA